MFRSRGSIEGGCATTDAWRRPHLFRAGFAGILLTLNLLCASLQAQEQYQETIEVVRYLLTVRANDSRGEAISDLTPADFIIDIDGRRAAVEAADWIGANTPVVPQPEEQPPLAGGSRKPVAAPGRFIVFFVQTDFGRAPQRVQGQMHFNNTMAPQIVAMFRENDRIAVVSHDSHLKLALDFTTDRKAAVEAIRQAIFIRDVRPASAPATGPSMSAVLGAAEMKRSATGESSLLLIARALSSIEGEKIVVLAGWGFGDYKFGTPWIFYEPEWPAAIRTLQSRRIPVISLGTGLLGGQLTTGLVSVAQQTGGFYAGTQMFPEHGLKAIDSFLEGHYELVLRLATPLKPGEHQVKARVSRKGARVRGPEKVIIFAQSRPDPTEASPDVAPPAITQAQELYAAAMQALLDGNAERAEELLTRALATEPRHADAWYERGMLRAAGDDRAGAAKDLRQYLHLAPRGRHAADAREVLTSLE